jgi:serine/threonine-protein kinase
MDLVDHHLPVSDVEDLPPGAHVGEYVITGTVGTGAMGRVLAATRSATGTKVAIKLLSRTSCADPAAVARFVQEARTVNRLGHPSIVHLRGFGELPDGRSYVVMEWLDGERLGDRLRRERVGGAESLDLLEDIAGGLEAAHAQGIVHRDLTPDNVFLARADAGRVRVKLLDFGLAKLIGGDDGREGKTRTGALLGTPLYMSPEQARCWPVDARSDVYSLGVIAYQMLAGAVPFSAASDTEVMYKHIHAAPEPPSKVRRDVSMGLDALVLAMLAKQPADRPSLGEVRARLGAERRRADQVRRPPPEPTIMVSAASPHARALGVAGLVVAAVLLAIIVFFALRPASSTDVPVAAPAAAPEARPMAPVEPAPVEPAPVEPAPVAPVVIDPPRGAPALVAHPPRKPVVVKPPRPPPRAVDDARAPDVNAAQDPFGP